MIITPAQLQLIFPNLRDASAIAGVLAPACNQHGINTPARLTAFLAQCGHESNEFQAARENLNYSANGLLATWPRRFNPTKAAALARKPEQIANEVYGGRLGNTEPGDGWRYRGGGWIQLTGRENYRRVGRAIGARLEEEPELIELPHVAAHAAAYFWFSENLNALADDLSDDNDDADFLAITRKINGGTNGLEDRRRIWRQARKVLGA